MKVASVGSISVLGNVEQNLQNTLQYIDNLATLDVDFIFFPELNLSGYLKDKDSIDWILKQETRFLELLIRKSERMGISFAVGFPEKIEGKYFIAHHVISKGKLVGTHRKTHLSPGEKEIYSEADEIQVFKINDATIGIQLCYETHFPEISAIQSGMGANLLAFGFASPGETGTGKLERFKRYLPARAYDNNCYVIACNQDSLLESGCSIPGLSLAIDPKGMLVAESSSRQDNYAVTLINLEQIKEIQQSKMACFNKHKRANWLKKYYEEL